jgi:hypothetical protein
MFFSSSSSSTSSDILSLFCYFLYACNIIKYSFLCRKKGNREERNVCMNLWLIQHFLGSRSCFFFLEKGGGESIGGWKGKDQFPKVNDMISRIDIMYV